MLTAPLVPDTKIDIQDLTHATVEGNGVFDVLMRAVNAHLQKEWSANRLKGTEYSTVYLGALESTMSASLQFVLAKDKANAELDILKQQLLNLKVEEANAIKQGLQLTAQTAVTTQQKVNLEDELLTAAKQRESIDSEITVRNRQIAVTEAQSTKDLLVKEAQIVQTAQQTSNLLLEAGNIPKQGFILDAEKNVKDQQVINLSTENTRTAAQTAQIIAETSNVPKQGLILDQQKINLVSEQLGIVANTAQTTKQTAAIDEDILIKKQQVLVSTAEVGIAQAKLVNIPKEGLVLDKQALQIAAQTALTTQQTANVLLDAANIPKQGQVLDKQVLDAIAKTSLTEQQKLNAIEENALIVKNVIKTEAEKELLVQKKVTELANTDGTVANATSVVGKQTAVLTAQANGYARDAEQKAAEILMRGYSVLATNQDLTATDSIPWGINTGNTNTAITKLLAGI